MLLLVVSIILLFLLLLNHDVLPLAGLVVLELEVDLVHCTAWVKIDPEVAVVEDRLHRVVGRIVNRILAASGRLDEEGLLNLSVTFLEKHPTVESGVTKRIISFKIRCIIIDGDGSESLLFL